MSRHRFQKGRLLKRGKIWAARWYENVLLEDGRLGRLRRYVTFGPIQKDQAKHKLAAILEPINQGKSQAETVMTFGQFVRQRWIPAAMPLLDPVTMKVKREAVGNGTPGRPGTAETYGSKLRTHLLPALEDRPLREIGRFEVARLLSEKQQQGFAAAHVRAMRATLSKVMKTAVDWQLLAENPVHGCHVESGEPKRERVHLRPEQAALLVASLPEPCRSVVLVTVLSGCRIGEVLGLRWSSVDLAGGNLAIRQTFSERWGYGPPKTKRSLRMVPMSRPLFAVLTAHRSRCKFTGEGDPVFATKNGTPLSSKNLRSRVLEPRRRTLGLPVLSWHDLRHTLASWLGQAGAITKEVQEVLGHSTAEMSLHYTHTLPEQLRATMERASEGIWALMGTSTAGGTELVN